MIRCASDGPIPSSSSSCACVAFERLMRMPPEADPPAAPYAPPSDAPLPDAPPDVDAPPVPDAPPDADPLPVADALPVGDAPPAAEPAAPRMGTKICWP